MTEKQNIFSLVLLLGFLFFALPLHADELTKAQSKEISALWDEAQRLVGEEDYQAALKITEQALAKLEQWRADEFPLVIWTDLQVQILMRDQQFRVALKKQKEILSLTKDLYGDDAPETVSPRVQLNDLEKIAALIPEQQKELSEGEAAYHAAVAERDLEKAIKLGEQMAAKEKNYLGEDCTWYTNSLSLLAGNYIAAKKYKQAEAKYLEGLKVIQKLYGQMHLNTAIWYEKLHFIYGKTGDTAKAESTRLRIFKIRQPVYSDQLEALPTRVRDLVEAGNGIDQAIKTNQEYIQLLDYVFKEVGSSPLNVQSRLFIDKAKAQIKSGNKLKAQESLEQALHFCVRAKGMSHKDTAAILRYLGTVYHDSGNFDKAVKCILQSLEIHENISGAESEETAKDLLDLAILYDRLNESKKSEQFYTRVLALSMKLNGQEDQATLDISYLLSKLYLKLRRYDESAALVEKVLELQQQKNGNSHRDIVKYLELLAQIHRERQDFTKAEPIFRRILEIREQALEQDDSRIADTLNFLGMCLNERGQFAEAEQCYLRAKKIRTTRFGGEHPETAVILGNLGINYADQAKYDQAIQLYRKELEIMQRKYGEEDLLAAGPLNSLGVLYFSIFDFEKAKLLLGKAHAIREKKLGQNHLLVAGSLVNLGVLFSKMGDDPTAIDYFERALSIYQDILGKGATATVSPLNSLGLSYGNLGSYKKAEKCFLEALDICEQSLEESHRDKAYVLNSLAVFYNNTGDFRKSLQYLHSALRLCEETLGSEHPTTAAVHCNIGDIYLYLGNFVESHKHLVRSSQILQRDSSLGLTSNATELQRLARIYARTDDHAKAELLMRKVIAHQTNIFGEEHPLTISSLHDLGVIYSGAGDYRNAKRFLLRSLELNKKLFGEINGMKASHLSSLGVVFSKMGQYEKAVDYYKSALEVSVRKQGANHPETAKIMISTSANGVMLGDYENAETLCKQAYAILKENFGENHADTSFALYQLAHLLERKGNIEKAMELYLSCLQIDLKRSNNFVSIQSDRQQILSGDELLVGVAEYIGRAIQYNQNVQEIYAVAIEAKGVVGVRQRKLRSLLGDPELSMLLKEAQEVTAKLAAIANESRLINSDLRGARLAELSDQKEAIEREISSKTKLHRQVEKKIKPDLIQSTVPKNGAVIDFYTYARKLHDTRGNINAFDTRLAAFIIRPEAPIELVDLCSYEDLERALATWKENLGRNTGPATELGKLIWEPLAEHVDDTELVLYSPIAELGSVPFAALPGKEPGSYLLEEKQLVMIPQAKLLPALLEREQSPKPTVLAIGGVDYESAANNETEEPVKLAASRRAVRWNDEAVFTPLPETESELEAVGKLYNQQFDLGKLQTLKGDRATEAAVKRLAPQYSHLHFATHGFFAPPEVKSALDNSENRFERQLSFDDQPRFTGFHPGLLSGLALAGANDPPEEGEDGIWTAEEVATMNLSKVDLAVLSACETGLGKVAGGEGLLGLQRAFQVSGAGTTVASLWQVDDAATRALMDEFYRNLWEKKLPKIEALRQAQLKMLREYDPQKGTLRGVGGVRQLDTDGKPERLPPFYWAAWVLSGDWR